MNKLKFFLSCSTILASLTLNAKVQPVDGIAAVVNDSIITKSELAQQIKIIEKQIRQNGNVPPDYQTLSKQVLDHLILNEVQLQMAKKTGINIDDAQLDNAIENIAKQNQMTVTQMREALTQENIDYDRYRSNVRQQIMVNQLQQRDLMHEIQVSEQEVSQFLRSPNGMGGMLTEFRLGHILIPLSEAPSPEELEKATQKTNNIINDLRKGKDFAQVALNESSGKTALDGGDLGWKKLPELPTLFESVVPKLRVSEIPDAIRSSSGFHIIKLLDKRTSAATAETRKTLVRHILVKTNAMTSDREAKQRLSELRSKILKGDDFAQLAQTNSSDLGSASNGGSLGWVTKEVLVPEFSQVMEKLNVNDVSEPFKSPFGWHIVQVLDRKSESSDESGMRQKAKNMIQQRKYEEKLQAWSRQIRDEAYVKTFLEG